MPLGKSFTEGGFWMDHVVNACLGGVNLIHHKLNADSAMLLFFFLSCLLLFFSRRTYTAHTQECHDHCQIICLPSASKKKRIQ